MKMHWRSGKWDNGYRGKTRCGRTLQLFNMTTDSAKVTCKRCLTVGDDSTQYSNKRNKYYR